ncbi:MAG: pyrroline-5-carboxylate reductase [Candidatus Eremiobacterota bacterium]
MIKDKKITIIGCGTMGKIIISGLLSSGTSVPENLIATDKIKETRKKIHEEFFIETTEDNVKACTGADIILLAVKPQDIPAVIGAIKEKITEKTVIISIAAGVSTNFIEGILSGKNAVIRAMPNTACQVRNGMIVICRGKNAINGHIDIGMDIFSPLGKCIELDEKHMDAVTGLSASGPAFIYLIIEALADGGVMMGLPRKVAQDLVIHTVLGSAHMIKETERHPASLKDDVTTPAGCTISGILALEDGKIRSVLARAVQIAAARAGELGK